MCILDTPRISLTCGAQKVKDKQSWSFLRNWRSTDKLFLFGHVLRCGNRGEGKGCKLVRDRGEGR